MVLKRCKVMQERIHRMNWTFDYDVTYNKLKWKDKAKNLIEDLTGKRPWDFNNYRII
jgi:hypothetical protein